MLVRTYGEGVGAGLVGLVLLVVLLAPARADASRDPASRVVAPAHDRLVRGSSVAAKVRLARGARVSRIAVNGRSVRRTFHRRGRFIVGRLRLRRELRRGANTLVVSYRPRGKRRVRFVRSHFVVARRRARSMVSLDRVRGVRPLRLRFRTRGRPDVVRVTLNGRRLERHLRRSGRGRWSGMLSASHGLRFGRNRVRIVAYRFGGSYDLERTSVHARRVAPLPGAGLDRRVPVGRGVRLNSTASLVGWGRLHLRYRWRLLRAPKGSRPRLTRAHSARPLFRARRPGRYRIGLTVRAAAGRKGRAAVRRVASDSVVIANSPAVPPIGTPFHSLVRAPETGISIGDQFTPAAEGEGGPGTLNLFLIDRQTLTVRTQWFDGQSSSSLQELARLVADQTARTLVVISAYWQFGTGPIAPNLVDDFNDIVEQLNGSPLPASAVSAQPAPSGFSVVGVANSAYEQATSNPGQTTSPTVLPGDVHGYLGLNGPVGDSDSLFSFSSPDYFTYDTNVPGQVTGQNVMNIGPLGNTPAVELPAGTNAGFAVLVVDPATLQRRPGSPTAFGTNSSIGLSAGAEVMARYIQDQAREPALFFIQSIGNPSARASLGWDSLVSAMESIGATPDVLGRLDGTFGYAYVGGKGVQGPAAETASKLATFDPSGNLGLSPTGAPPQLSGLLARNGFSSFQPVANDPLGLANFQIPIIAFQGPTSWPVADPSLGSSGQRSAMAYIAGQLFPCSGSPNCTPPSDVRPLYFSSANAEGTWGSTKLSNLRELCYPWASGCNAPKPSAQATFTQADFEAVQGSSTDLQSGTDSLDTEFQYVYAVQQLLGGPNGGSPTEAYAGELPSIFNPSNPAIDLSQLHNDVQQSTSASGSADTNGPLFTLIGEAATALVPFGTGEPAQAALGVLASTYFLAGSQGGAPLNQLNAEVQNLESELMRNFSNQATRIEHISDILVSDWGKLSKVGGGLVSNSTQWSFEEGEATQGLQTSTIQWLYSELMPAEWRLYQLNPGRDNKDPKSATSYNCADKYPFTLPFKDEPPTGQFPAIIGFTGAPIVAPITRIQAWGKGDISGGHETPSFDNPKSSLTDPLWQPPGDSNKSWSSPNNSGVGLFPSWFLSRSFPNPKQLNC